MAATDAHTDATSSFAIELTIDSALDGVNLSPNQEFNFEVRNADEIHMLRALATGKTITLLMTLGSSYGAAATVTGLSFGETPKEAEAAILVLDTRGELYPNTPFIVAPGPNAQSVELTIKRGSSPAEEAAYSFAPWHCDLGVASSTFTGRQRIDPKIYNKGDQL